MSIDAGSLAAEFTAAGLESRTHWELAPLTTYGVGGAAACGVRIDDEDDARRAARILASRPGTPLVVIGRGSNVLVSDDGFDGVALLVSLGASSGELSLEGDVLSAPGRMPMPVLARRSAALGRGGLEWAVGIPGSTGGAVRMNAGGHGSDMASVVRSVLLLSLVSGREVRVERDDLGLHFRGSALAPHHLVLGVDFDTVPVDPGEAAREIARIVSWRRDNQPGGRNAGSVFVNPGEGPRSAGALVDSSGFRGATVGGAAVSDKHANFIIAGEGATAGDIVALMERIQEGVKHSTGIVLRSEVRLVGFDAGTNARFADPRHATGERAAASSRLASMMGDR